MIFLSSRIDVASIALLREEFRNEAGCQIVRDSILPRGLADCYCCAVDGQQVGYGGVWNQHFPGRVMEFYIRPQFRHATPELFRAFVIASGAVAIEAQTNIPLSYALLRAHTTEVERENVLFGDGPTTDLSCPQVTFRERVAADFGPEGDWVQGILSCIDWGGMESVGYIVSGQLPDTLLTK